MNKNRKKSKSNNNIPSEIITSPGLSSDLQISISTKRGEASKSLEEIRLELKPLAYILGFTEDFNRAQKSLSDYKLEVVYNF